VCIENDTEGGQTRKGTSKMKTKACSLVAALFLTLLAACGGGGSESDGVDNPDSFDASAGRFVGVEGVQFSYQKISGASGASTPTTGETGVSGKFNFGYFQAQTCKTDSETKKETCSASGPPIYKPTAFSICGVSMAELPPPPAEADIRGAPTYTAWDFFSDQTSIDNMASVLLMGNVNKGDPLTTGIKLSLKNSSCQSFNWTTPNIQQGAASIQTTAKADGLAHDWPSPQAISDYLLGTYRCSRAGAYFGIQENAASSNYAARTLSGSFEAIVDFDGHVEGAFDFTRGPGTAPYAGPVLFSGDYTIAPGGVGSLTYVAPDSAPYPGMTITMSLFPYGATGSYQTADGSLAGTTASTNDPGMGISTSAPLAKYRFIEKNVSYTRPGGTAPENFVLWMEVGSDNDVSASLREWAPSPWNEPLRGFLSLHGSMNGNSVKLEWYDDTIHKDTPANKQPFTLTLDPSTSRLTGIFPGYSGEPFITFTDSQPLQGCRL
jgi:hypothetical protein